MKAVNHGVTQIPKLVNNGLILGGIVVLYEVLESLPVRL
jgi:hypothetical protein